MTESSIIVRPYCKLWRQHWAFWQEHLKACPAVDAVRERGDREGTDG